jgi:DNA-binding transcriptional ArsR family regulator
MNMDSIATPPADPIHEKAADGTDSPATGSAGSSTDVCDVSYVEADLLAHLRPNLVAPQNAAALAATFAVLGDPTRVRLLDALAQRELCVCELAELVGSTESAVSHQLRLLRSLRLVRSRRAGRMVYYALDDDHIRALLTQGRKHIEEGVR